MSLTCFVLMPFKEPFFTNYSEVIAPAIENAGFTPVRGDAIPSTGAVIDDILMGVYESDAVLADVTGMNSNVVYELGLAHAMQRRAIIVCQRDQVTPFNFAHRRRISYDVATESGKQSLRHDITNSLRAILSELPRVRPSYRDERIVCGTGIAGTQYDYEHLIDEECEEVVFVGTNLRALLRTDGFKSLMLRRISGDQPFSVTFICTTYQILHAIIPQGAKELVQSLIDFQKLRESLSEATRNRVKVWFHPDAVSLSAMICDSNSERRGILTFSPRWAADTEPNSRAYCVVERKGPQRAVFDKISSCVIRMAQKEYGGCSLADIVKEMASEVADLRASGYQSIW